MPGLEKSNEREGHLHFLCFCAFAKLWAGLSIPALSLRKTIGRSPSSCQSPIVRGGEGWRWLNCVRRWLTGAVANYLRTKARFSEAGFWVTDMFWVLRVIGAREARRV